MSLQAPHSVVMVPPRSFAFNAETAVSNYFQNASVASNLKNVREKAAKEFSDFVNLLEKKGVEVILLEERLGVETPDAVFPNNWFSTHADGTFVLYPMQAENRRLERNLDLLVILEKKLGYQVKKVLDISLFEHSKNFLEGTGSIIYDHEHKYALASLSERTSAMVLGKVCHEIGYKPILFEAFDKFGLPIYHTNVLMTIGEGFLLVCSTAISDPEDLFHVKEYARVTQKQIIEITLDQLHKYAGNMIQLSNKKGDKFIILSRRAMKSLSTKQVQQLEKHGELIYPSLETIEDIGGGSARCMIGGIHLPPVAS
jgi:hypothetical protein